MISEWWCFLIGDKRGVELDFEKLNVKMMKIGVLKIKSGQKVFAEIKRELGEI